MKRADKIIFAVTLFVSVFAILFSNVFFSGKTAKHIVIEVDGKIYGKYDLPEEKNSNTLEINTKYGYNKVVMENNGVYVTESSCPKKEEILQGKIQKPGEMLVCLPNRLLIKIMGESEVDGLAY